MNKADLVARIAEMADMPKVVAEKALNAFMEAVIEALKEGEKVTLVGFGTFSVVERAERVGRNPRTGEQIRIPPRKVVKFKPGNRLEEAIK